MADTRIWIGGVSTDYAVANNWNTPAGATGLPVNGDRLLLNDQAQQGCLVNCDSGANGHTYTDVEATSGYVHGFGASADEFDPTAITQLRWASGFVGESYIKGPITDGVIDAQSAGEAKLICLSTLDTLTVRRGVLHLQSGAALTAGAKKLTILQAAGGTAEVKADAAVDFTGSTIEMTGGKLTSAADVVTLSVLGGEAALRGDAIATTVTTDRNGVFFWDSSGDITTFHALGGKLDATRFAREKTLATLFMHGDAVVDLRTGADLITVSAAWILGNNSPLVSPGTLMVI